MNNEDVIAYLIFFGKSQSFTFRVFDRQSFFENFDNIIPGFSLLESEYFTTDKIENRPILAKYHFKRVKDFTMIKLYSCAQAVDSNRIAGSIYGVAFLSEGNLSLCPENIKLLTEIKNFFGEVCLNKGKFKSGDFRSEVIGIWKQFCNRDGFSMIKYAEKTQVVKSGVVGIYADDLLKAADAYYERVYFSEDIDHLKRANEMWKDRFPLYQMVNGHYEPFKEPIFLNSTQKTEKTMSQNRTQNSETDAPDQKIIEQTARINELTIANNELLQSKKKFKRFSGFLLIVLIVAVLSSLVYHIYTGNKSVSEKDFMKRLSDQAELTKSEVQRNTAIIENLSKEIDSLRLTITSSQKKTENKKGN